MLKYQSKDESEMRQSSGAAVVSCEENGVMDARCGHGC